MCKILWFIYRANMSAWGCCTKQQQILYDMLWGRGFLLGSDFILSRRCYDFWMHAILITTNILQHCPDGRHGHTCALEGTRQQHVSQFISHGRWIRRVSSCYNFSCLYKMELFLNFISRAASHLFGPENFTCKLVQYFEKFAFHLKMKITFWYICFIFCILIPE